MIISPYYNNDKNEGTKKITGECPSIKTQITIYSRFQYNTGSTQLYTI